VTNKTSRIEYVDILRGMAVIFMLMGHIGGQAYIDRYIHMFHMPVWFFISGFLFRDKGDTFKVITRKKAKTLILPYFVWGLIQYPFWIIFARNYGKNVLEPVKNLFWINTNLLMPIAGALWFLTCLFFAELIFIVIRRTIKNNKILFVSVAAIAALGNAFTSIFSFRLPWAIDASFVAVGLLYVGNYFSTHRNDKYVSYLLNLPKKICFVIFVINGIMCFINGYINMRIGMYGFILLFWVNAIMSILVYWNFSKYLSESRWKLTVKWNDWLKQIGRNSIVYLCLNQLVILAFDLLLKSYGFTNLNWCLRGILILSGTLIILNYIETFVMNTKLKVLFGR